MPGPAALMRFQQMGARAEAPGHDLTYLAENDLIAGLELPAMLYAAGRGYRWRPCWQRRHSKPLPPGYAAKHARRLTSWRETKTYRFLAQLQIHILGVRELEQFCKTLLAANT